LNSQNDNEAKGSRLSYSWALLCGTAILIVSAFFVPGEFTCMQVSSDSMAPTLHTGDYIVVRKYSDGNWSIAGGSPHFGDVAVFARPTNASALFPNDSYIVKRIVAMGGDAVSIKNGQLEINGAAVKELYVPSGADVSGPLSSWPLRDLYSPSKGFVVPPGSIFVLGDNRANSTDSRLFGVIPSEAAIGKVIFSFQF
jgi:signal peptidase I